ncbi:MAG TPA: BTAD domain-containing putative transcriptional regulator [Streptosporangiaceae bacterium]|jgi:DNA-binding SARP family transcriptional activator
MRLRILGPLELVADRRMVKIGGPREHVVLAALALRANRVVSVDQLIDAAWGDAPPTTARSQVQTCISALRKVLDGAGLPDAIETRPAGYLLRISPDDLDSEKFAGLVADARALAAEAKTTHAAEAMTAQAAAMLREALGLWRGPALANLPGDLMQQGAALLEEERLAAVEERMRLDLELGRHEEVTGELTALVAEQPLRERLQGFLMLAHYRSGRQGEALAVYRRARAILDAELGVEPCQELRDLERAVLNHDPTLDLPAPPAASAPPADTQQGSPRQLPSSVADFIGRQLLLDQIKAVLPAEQDSAGQQSGWGSYAVPVIAISGRGGVGKSTLALRAAHELAGVYPDGHLYVDLGNPVGDDHTATLLARFLRALGVSGSMIPEEQAERAEMYRSRLSSKRLLLVLDGVQSEDQVIPLLPGSPSCAVIVTSRSRLSGLSGARFIDVEVFDDSSSKELLASVAGAQRLEAEPEAAAQLVRYCGGLPLALRIAGARLAARPHWRVADLARRLKDERHRLDELSHHGLELRSSIGLTYRSLPAKAQRLFRLFASIQAPDFPGWTAAALLDTELTGAEDLIEQLIDAQMLDAVQGPTGDIRYRFHDLIRVYAAERLAETETDAQQRGALSRVLGGWLALAEQAHRAEYGGDYTILHGSAPRWEPADPNGDQVIGCPMDWLENERAALVCAIRQAAEAGLDEVCWDLALTSVSLFEVKSYLDDWRETAEVAHEATARAGNQTGRAAMAYSLGSLHLFQKRLDDASRYFDEALEIFQQTGDVHGQALVLRNSAMVDRYHGNVADMVAKYEQALPGMRAVGDLVGVATILRSLARFRIDEGATDEAGQMLEEALTLCQQAGYLRGEAQVMTQFAELYLRTGAILPARQALHRVLRTVREIGDRMGEAHVLYSLGIVRYREGRLDNAEATLVHALSLAQRVSNRFIEGQARYALAEIAVARGDNSGAASHLDQARAAFGELDSPFWQAKTLILLHELSDELDEPGDTARYLEEAAGLLAGVNSKEAAEVLGHLDQARAWMQADQDRLETGTT